MQKKLISDNKDKPVNISTVGKTAYDDKYAMDDEPEIARPVSAVKAVKPEKKKVVKEEAPKPIEKQEVKPEEKEKAVPEEKTEAAPEAAEVKEEIAPEAESKKDKSEKPSKKDKSKKEKKAKGGLFGKRSKTEDQKEEPAAEVDVPAKEEAPAAIEAEAPVEAPITEIAEQPAEVTEEISEAVDQVAEDTAEAVTEAAEEQKKKSSKFNILALFNKKKQDDGDTIKMAKGSTKIKYRILRLSIVSVIASVVIMQVYSTINTITSYQDNYTEQAQALVTSYMQTLDTKLDTMTMQLTALRSNSTMYTAANPEEQLSIRKYKLNELATSTMFKFIDFADMNGDTVSETNIADREYFIRAKEGINTLSSPLVRRASGIDAAEDTVMILGIKYQRANLEGVITGGIEPSELSSGFTGISEGNNVVVLDKNGTVIAATDMTLVKEGVNYKEHEKSGYKQLAESMLTNEAGTIRYTVDGTEYLAAYSPIELTDGWTIAVSLNYSKVTSEMFTNLLIAIGIAVVVIVVTSVIGMGVANKISKPINVVANRLQKLSEGDISTEFNMEAPKDETKVLTDSLSNTITELNKYISDIRAVLADIAEGDLTAKSDIEYLGDFTAIGTSLEQITASLGVSFSAVKASVDSIKSGAAQVADGSQHLSETAIKEAEVVDEILSTIGGITEQANSTAQASVKVLTITNEANANAQRGADMMKELLAAIQNIKEKSDAISAVIKTIDSIAFQTNILALNASIEAARAGEAGRGFSVVAQEVGNLASMSADAVKQTASLINDSMAAVDQGTAIADKAENAIRSIAADVNQVASYMGDIVTAANEQNSAVEQITAGINRIDSGMHLTTATAEQSAASSEQLSELAVSLSNEVERFKTE